MIIIVIITGRLGDKSFQMDAWQMRGVDRADAAVSYSASLLCRQGIL